MAGRFKIFNGGELSDYFQNLLRAMRAEVESQADEYLLNVNETQFAEYLVSKYQVESLEIDFDQKEITDKEAQVRAEDHPGFYPDFQRRYKPGERYARPVVTYHLPYSGNEGLFHLAPSRYVVWTEDVWLEDGCLCFDIVIFQTNETQLKEQADRYLKNIRENLAYIKEDVLRFNKAFGKSVLEAISQRKEKVLKRKQLVKSLGVPIRKRDGVPSTFAVPVVKKNIVVSKPGAPTHAFKPEPTLENAAYSAILKMLYDVGVQMETHPGIYIDKLEETLRDHFLMVLAPNFGNATGETFNKTGKTDILVKHEGKNIFIAECKFWSGVQAYLKTIDQLLSYLTWRDSKAAVLLFVRNKELQPVLDQIVEKTHEHSCFVKDRDKKEDGWYEYEFHLKDDPSRGVYLAVLCFHFPRSDD